MLSIINFVLEIFSFRINLSILLISFMFLITRSLYYITMRVVSNLLFSNFLFFQQFYNNDPDFFSKKADRYKVGFTKIRESTSCKAISKRPRRPFPSKNG